MADTGQPIAAAETESTSESGAESTPDSGRPRGKLPFWLEVPLLVAICLVLTFLIQTFVARVYLIPSGSMEHTLEGANGVGDRILVDEMVYDFHDPRPGDVVVFGGPAGWVPVEYQVSATTDPVLHWLRQFGASVGLSRPDEYDLVKRVIAVGGQTVYCCDAANRVVVNGRPLAEPYVYWEPGRGGPAQQQRFGPVTVPRGYLWVMGDNRNDSDDSRFQNQGGIHGVVPVANVIGKARTIIWPPSRWGGVGDDNPQTLALVGVGVVGVWPTRRLGHRLGHRLTRRLTHRLTRRHRPFGRAS